MTINEFVTTYRNKTVDWDGYYGGQCVDLIRKYIDKVLETPQPHGVNGAADFWDAYATDAALLNYFSKVANTPYGIPKEGDIIIWNRNVGYGYGHAAIYLRGEVMSFTSFDQNWTATVCKEETHNYDNVLGWFSPINMSSNLKDVTIDWDDFEGHRHTVGWYVHEWMVEKKNEDSKWKELYEGLVKDLTALAEDAIEPLS